MPTIPKDGPHKTRAPPTLRLVAAPSVWRRVDGGTNGTVFSCADDAEKLHEAMKKMSWHSYWKRDEDK